MRLLLALALSFLVLLPAAAAAPQSPLQMTACTAGKSKLPAHCGVLRVYENRAAHSGRTIGIHFIVVDAAKPSNRAIFWNPGGPGGDDLTAAGYIADGLFMKEMRKLHGTYNMVFMDNRGTGKSHGFDCDAYPKTHPETYFKQLFPDAALEACRARLAKTTDLNQYTTDITAADLDQLREALHYPKIVLDGGSYGTMFYLDYARRYPAHVESLALRGVAPPGYLIIPLEDAQGAQKAMDDLIADCSHNSVCNKHFPNFGAHFNALVHRFDRGPIPVPIVNAATKRSETVLLSKEVFADRLRQILYDDEGAAYVPYIVDEAYNRNYVPLGRMIELITDVFGRGLDIGLNLSVTCAEDIPFITPQLEAQTSAGSFQGDTRVRAQQHACQIWNVARASADFAQPVHSDAPILMMSSLEDPASPPQYGTEALKYLPNGRQILIPHASHESDLDCEDDLIARFILSRNAKALDASHCIGTSQRPPFATSLKGFPTAS